MTARRFFLLLVACAAAGCTQPPEPIPPMAESGELVILTVNGPATYFEDAQGHPSGFEHDLATLFARELGVRPAFKLLDDPAALETMLRAGQAHLAAAALARHLDFPGGLAWGPSYFTTQHQVVGRSGISPRPKSLADVAGKRVGVVELTVAEQFLRSPPSPAPPQVERMPAATTTADLLERIEKGELDFGMVESNRFTLARRHYPQIEVLFNVGKPVNYAWLLSRVDSKAVHAKIGPFFQRIHKDGTLKRLVDRYYGHATRLTAIDSGTLIDRIGTDLPGLKPHFLEAEAASGIDWRLVAALGYQESHWDASATSPTGVRGLMMLTEDTANRLQVGNRLDARASIVGGARYFALLKEALPQRIPEPDLTYFALAAYNLGLGHLEDARLLAQRAKLDPDKWQDVRQVLPRLADPEHFLHLKHGYARGFEAMQLVDNVRNYYDVLARLAPREGPLAPAAQLSTKGTTPGK
jgi:membrane-bound lytic murein transglycosylase F